MMSSGPRAILAGIGGYLPPRIVTNDELAGTLDTSDAWIRERTGIHERRIVGEGESCASMATAAARQALEIRSPSESSSCATCIDSDGCAMPQASAALRKFPCSAIASKYCSCRNVIGCGG